MKLRLLLFLCAIFAFGTAMQAQATPDATGKIHGHVTDPTGVPRGNGTATLSTDGGKTIKYTFPVNAAGDYTGTGIAPGTYQILLSFPDTPAGKYVDEVPNVKIVAGQDVAADFDMSRKEYIDKLSPELQKQVEEFKKKNAEAMKSNAMIKVLNSDLATARANIHDGDQAQTTAAQALGASASKADLAAKVAAIKTEKYGAAAALMQKDTALKPDAGILWVELGNADNGLGKYDDAITAFKKALDADAASKKPNPELQGAAQSGIGTAYIHEKKSADAATAFDAAAKAAPAQASMYYANETKLLYAMNSTGAMSDPDAQAAAADKAIAATPASNTPAYAILFYLKAQALTQKATFDAKTQKIVLPPGTVDAYQKYLSIDPNGLFAKDATDVLTSAGEKVQSHYRAKK
jgi:tetratricopeptide (TPR) repeat protein